MHPEKPEIPSESDRLKIIFTRLSELPPSSDAWNAAILIQNIFDSVEEENVPVGGARMYSYDLSNAVKFNKGPKEIYFQQHAWHGLFIGQNGAIDIRRMEKKDILSDRILFSDPLFPKNNYKLEFEKDGADGKGVWE